MDRKRRGGGIFWFKKVDTNLPLSLFVTPNSLSPLFPKQNWYRYLSFEFWVTYLHTSIRGGPWEGGGCGEGWVGRRGLRGGRRKPYFTTVPVYRSYYEYIILSYVHTVYSVLILLPLVNQSFFRHIMRYAVSSPKFLNILIVVFYFLNWHPLLSSDVSLVLSILFLSFYNMHCRTETKPQTVDVISYHRVATTSSKLISEDFWQWGVESPRASSFCR